MTILTVTYGAKKKYDNYFYSSQSILLYVVQKIVLNTHEKRVRML